jgi:hypothetical protein
MDKTNLNEPPKQRVYRYFPDYLLERHLRRQFAHFVARHPQFLANG